MGDVITNKTLMAARFTGISPNDIRLFSVDENDNISFRIEKSYGFSLNAFLGLDPDNEKISYYFDLDGFYNGIGRNTFNRAYQIKYALFPLATTIAGGLLRFVGGNNKIFAFPSVKDLGSSTGNNNTFDNASGDRRLISDISQETIANGSPDGDITNLINGGGNVVYSPTLKTKPNPINNISASNISQNSAVINYTLPSNHTYDFGYVLVFINGFFIDIFNAQNTVTLSLISSTQYEVKVILADVFFNLSSYSNTITFSTL
jgi:hypothetical protein